MQAAQVKAYESGAVLYMAMELSNSKWKLGFSNGSKLRRKSIDARDRHRCLEEVALAKAKLKLAADAPVVCCFEAGRDGHWIHRWLESEGFEVLEIDSSSIETARGRKHVKTDRVDVEKLLDLLIRHHCFGLRKAFRVVRVPCAAAEAAQRLHREDEYLLKQRTRISNRIKGLLAAQGVVEVPLRGDFSAWLDQLRLWNDGALSAQLKTELRRLYTQYQVFDGQLAELADSYAEELLADTPLAEKRRQLESLKGIGPKSSRPLSAEVFSWRTFANTKQVGAMSGLTPTPSQSGDTETEQGISKAGNRRVRRIMIELAWLWLRWQPDSALSQWFNRRFAHGGKRMRRIGIVALARKLLIALWRYTEHGVIPEGAVLKTQG
ncbi:MAG: IS110 family transposase [Pseudomonadota bacterium]